MVDAGRPTLEGSVSCRLSLGERVLRTVLDHPTAAYLLPILGVTATLVAAAGAYAGRLAPWAVVPALLLALVPALTAAL